MKGKINDFQNLKNNYTNHTNFLFVLILIFLIHFLPFSFEYLISFNDSQISLIINSTGIQKILIMILILNLLMF